MLRIGQLERCLCKDTPTSIAHQHASLEELSKAKMSSYTLLQAVGEP